MTDRIEPTLEDTLQLYAKRYGKEATFGDLPAKVLAYNPADQTANVQPLVLAYRNDRPQPVAILQQVQVRWPAGATWSIVGDLVAGDFGWIRFAGADISAWKMTGLELDPNADKRSGALSDCVFEPGSQPVSVPLAADAYKAGALVIKAAELLLGSSAAVLQIILDTDAVNKHSIPAPPSGFAEWMASVDAGLATIPYTTVPSASSVTRIGTAAANPATKVKGI